KGFGNVGAVVFDADSEVDEQARRKSELILDERAGVRPHRRDSPYSEPGKALDNDEFARCGAIGIGPSTVENCALLFVFGSGRDEMARERRDVGLIAQPAAAVVIVEIIAAIVEGPGVNRRIGSSQILSDRVEILEIVFGVSEREAIAPAFG